MESSPGVYGPPDEDSYSVDFIIDTLNQAYSGCTGVYLSDAGHIFCLLWEARHAQCRPNPGAGDGGLYDHSRDSPVDGKSCPGEGSGS